MQPSTHTVDSSSPPSDHRMPLGIRIIAGVLLILGTCGVVDLVIEAVMGRGMGVDLSPAVLLLGWGLLRRREWARVFLVFLLSMMTCVGGIMAVVVLFADMENINISPDPGDIGDLPRRLYAICMSLLIITLGIFACRTLRSDESCDLFQKNPPITPFIVWNPLRWRFGLGTLFFLTVLVACVTMIAIMHPEVSQVWGEQWAARIDLTDSVYFPHGADPLPEIDLQDEYKSHLPDGNSEAYYRIAFGPINTTEPVLEYLVFNRWDASSKRVNLERGCSYGSGEWNDNFRMPGGPAIEFPSPVQVAEFYDRELHISELNITLLEFWSYRNHPDAQWSLKDLEQYITDLRKRVAARESSKSDLP